MRTHTCICNKALALPYTICHISVHTASCNVYYKSYEFTHSASCTVYHKSYECAHNVIYHMSVYTMSSIMYHITYAIHHTGAYRTGATAGTGDDYREYERNERYDRVQAIYYPLLIGRGASRRFPPGLGEAMRHYRSLYV